jgi:hypothetical protein
MTADGDKTVVGLPPWRSLWTLQDVLQFGPK